MKGPLCFNGGYLGGPWLAIPADPKQYRAADDDQIGCNRLFCPACEKPVKHVDRRRLAGWMKAADYQALYDDPHPENSKYVGTSGAGQEFRTYYCRCNAYNIAGIADADLGETGWTCAGHP